MKRIPMISKLALISLLTIFMNNMFSQTIFVSGEINSNTVWDVDTVKIIGDINVIPGVLLKVNPGTYVESQGYYKINVSGTIKAIGTLNDTIYFTVNDTTNFSVDTNSVAGGWAGIRLVDNNILTDSSVFKFCRIQYAKKFDVYGGDVHGGAIFANNYSSLIIKNSIFDFNMVICYEDGFNGAAGGAIYCKDVNYALIHGNLFQRNRSFDHGGAIHIDVQSHAIISNNTFKKNRAIFWKSSGGWVAKGGTGAAVSSDDSFGENPTICNNYCFNNQSVNGMIYTSNEHSLIFNNLICNNEGPGIMDGHQLSTSHIFNNTIVHNLTSAGGISLYSRAMVYNNICWGNVRHGYDDVQIYAHPQLSNPQLFYNCVQFGEGGEFSINDYPEFTDPSFGVGIIYDGSIADWTLLDQSPCINRGTTDTTGLLIPYLDIARNPRIYGIRIEMGCYENQNVYVGLRDVANSKMFSIYPNPGNDIIKIESVTDEVNFELHNSIGQLILQKSLTRGIVDINTELFQDGIYFYVITNNKKDIIKSGKWIKTDN